jgi:hypothetical protein
MEHYIYISICIIQRFYIVHYNCCYHFDISSLTCYFHVTSCTICIGCFLVHIVVSSICSFRLLAQSLLMKRHKSFRRNDSFGLNHLSFNLMNLKTRFIFYFYYRNVHQISKVKVAKCQGPWEEYLIPYNCSYHLNISSLTCYFHVTSCTICIGCFLFSYCCV